MKMDLTQETISFQISELMRTSLELEKELTGLKKVLLTFGLQLKMTMDTGTFQRLLLVIHTPTMVIVVTPTTSPVQFTPELLEKVYENNFSVIIFKNLSL